MYLVYVPGVGYTVPVQQLQPQYPPMCYQYPAAMSMMPGYVVQAGMGVVPGTVPWNEIENNRKESAVAANDGSQEKKATSAVAEDDEDDPKEPPRQKSPRSS